MIRCQHVDPTPFSPLCERPATVQYLSVTRRVSGGVWTTDWTLNTNGKDRVVHPLCTRHANELRHDLLHAIPYGDQGAVEARFQPI